MLGLEPKTKADLRRAALARRLALDDDEVARRSIKLRENLFRQFPVAQWQWLHLFLPLQKRNEPDTWNVIRWVWGEELPLRLATPVVQPDGASLKHYELLPETQLTQNRWGIDEPVPDPTTAPEVFPAAFDAVLVPLLAVDRMGQRVGYGGGFYDRFLAQCRPGTQFIGLNVLDEQPVERIADVLPTDVPLTACITPGRVWQF
ncbi:5-formyltetrahydrofolate cyclo-ligase [Hymenobacter properus]|uniref:5-formyltetrahydrofolate cyclo-ligase n=1 Tax=Hymenobacter properus TaxID=2791026 RepID=A0A931BCK2_9BACT|nr:5-formyltetrahydrofolate cyclo-ligase [Hymenobacter properus]MBF9141309.1 5-formyltetrahydrofolate cyclo-ligase [Hymenobacter properus]MBR7720119.1 5-formyltetrahydrofolate cyclo-ligase [Microvirga sp. SRT04]